MANCPKCSKSIPWYKSLLHTKWTGVKCNYCGTKSFIRKKIYSGWFIFSGMMMGTIIALCKFIFHLSHLFSLLLLFLGGLILLYIVWPYVTLEMREN